MNEVKIKNKMTHEEVLSMLTHLVRIPQLYRTFKNFINVSLFNGDSAEDLEYGETPLAYIWLGLEAYYKEQKSNDAPTRELLNHYVRLALSNDCNDDVGLHQVLFTDEETGYIHYIYSPEREGLNAITGSPLIHQFIIERDVASQFKSLANQLNTTSAPAADSLNKELSKLADKAARVNSLGVNVTPVAVMPDDDYYSLGEEPLVRTGISFIDEGLGGGQRKGEVNGIIGCTGAGKTTLATQILAGNALVNHSEVLEGGQQELCLYYTYEQSASSLICNLQSNICKIARSSLERTWNLSRTPEERKEYERILWPTSTETEYDRWNMNKAWVNQSIILQNMSGVPDLTDVTEEQRALKRARGSGGIEEIQNDIEYLIDATGKPVRCVIIDYAGLVCMRQYGVEEDDSTIRQALGYMGDMCRKQIAGKYNCSVWLLQQMAGAVNGGNPCIPLHHSNAAGCKSFGDNMDTCICLGPPDCGDQTANGRGKCLYLTFSKTRHVAGNGVDFANRILQHDAYFCQLNDVTESRVPDRGAKMFRLRGGLYA